MTKNIRFRLIVVLAILIGTLYYLYPTIYLISLSPQKKEMMALSDPQRLEDLEKRSIKLGLDLQGGMHMVLELDKSKINMNGSEAKDAIDRALEIIRTRVDQFGVSEPLIQKAGDERIVVELAGIVDTSRARALVQQSAYLEFKLVKPQAEFLQVLRQADEVVRENNLYVLSDRTPAGQAQPAVGEAKDKSFNPSDLFNKNTSSDTSAQAPDSTAAKSDSSAAAADTSSESLLPGETAAADARQAPVSHLFASVPMRGAGQQPEGELLVPVNNIPLIKAYLAKPQVWQTVQNAEVAGSIDFTRYKSSGEDPEPDTLDVEWGDDATDYVGPDGTQYKRIFLMKKKPEMTGQFLADASATLGSGNDVETANKPLVLMTLTSAGADSFEVITERFLQRDLAIVLDNIVKFAPRIISRIPDGHAQITGVPTMDKARDLSIVLRAGALPAPLTLAESRTVGPSLGADSIQKGQFSAIVALIIVALFMLVYYRFSGMVANLALVFNMVMILAVLAGFNATLTLPGIAGLILTIGMAVDANVLIFERIREELRTGKSMRAAIDTGYERAFSTILDSNLTTFITAIVLFQFGTGPIKGFSVTLSIGLAANMFTAVYFTRVIFDLWTARKSVKSISI
ncbi:protein translocase subunit SecD [bacterium]|nr:protein translocase subunit SecD [bacterium]